MSHVTLCTPSVRHLEYFAKISSSSFQIFQDLTKKSKIDSKNIFVEYVVMQATLPEIEQYLFSEVEALC